MTERMISASRVQAVIDEEMHRARHLAGNSVADQARASVQRTAIERIRHALLDTQETR